MIKSVITAAGKGTRLLPTTHALPKELLPLFRVSEKKRFLVPILQIVFEQQFDIKIRDFCFVVGREKKSIKNHFTPHESYLNEINSSQRYLLSKFYKKLEKSHILWTNQNFPLGFGDAIRRTKRFVGNDDFIVHAGDVVIIGKSKHPLLRLIETAKKDASISAVLLCKKVKDTRRYGVPEIKKISNSIYQIKGVEEKPLKPKSNFGLLPIYYFKPEIFDCLKKIKRGKGNEFQLTDGIQRLVESGKKVLAITLNQDEVELDVGTVETYRYAQKISYKKAIL